MNEEKRKILDMLAEGKLTAEEAAMLLDQFSDDGPTAVFVRPNPGRMLRVRVDIVERGRPTPTHVEVNLPLAAAKALGQLSVLMPEQAKDAARKEGFDFAALDLNALIDSLAETGGDIVTVTHEDEDDQVNVRVYIE